MAGACQLSFSTLSATSFVFDSLLQVFFGSFGAQVSYVGHGEKGNANGSGAHFCSGKGPISELQYRSTHWRFI